MTKVLISANVAWNLFNFRRGLIKSLIDAGFEVVAVAPPDECVPELLSLGCRFIPLHMDSKGTHPGRDFVLLLRFLSILRRERPDCYLGYTIKPNVYGSLAAHALRIPVINNISGLGTTFLTDGWLNRIACCLYRLALSRSTTVFFQNPDDLSLFISRQLVTPRQAVRLPGSGIDLQYFQTRPLARRENVVFLMVARLLWDKGVREYVEAARRVKEICPAAVFRLLGFLGVANRSAVSESDVRAWVDEGTIEYLGSASDVRAHIAEADCVVLPSYREGTPRSLLEGAAMGRAIITTNAPGCREVVDDGISGFLCRPRDAADLAEKMLQFVRLSREEKSRFGDAGRRKMENQFDEQFVTEAYKAAINRAVGGRG